MKTRRQKARAKYKKMYSRTARKKSGLPALFLLRTFIFILICALTGLFYAKAKNDNVRMGFKRDKLKNRLEQLVKEEQILKAKLEQLKSPQSLRALIRHHNLNLYPPTKEQIVRLNRPQPLKQPSTQEKKDRAARAEGEVYTRLVRH